MIVSLVLMCLLNLWWDYQVLIVITDNYCIMTDNIKHMKVVFEHASQGCFWNLKCPPPILPPTTWLSPKESYKVASIFIMASGFANQASSSHCFSDRSRTSFKVAKVILYWTKVIFLFFLWPLRDRKLKFKTYSGRKV